MDKTSALSPSSRKAGVSNHVHKNFMSACKICRPCRRGYPILSLVTLIGAVGLIILVIAKQAVAHKASARPQDTSVTANLLAQSLVRNADTIRGMGMVDMSCPREAPGGPSAPFPVEPLVP